MKFQRGRAAVAFLAICSLADGGRAIAQDAGEGALPPSSWSVTGVAANDTLNMRDVPSGDAKIITRIPPGATGLNALGCMKKQLALDDWMELSKEARRDAQLLWCRVKFDGKEGWVAGRFLKPEK